MKRKSALVVGSLTLFVGLTEFVLRAAFGLGNPVIYAVSADYGYLPAPNQSAKRFGSTVKINHAGMRSPEFAELKPAATRRILFVGDSVTFGPTFVDQANLFATLVPDHLRKSGQAGNWEALNASAPGWATGNELGFVRDCGTFEADYVVLVVNTGDLDQPFAIREGPNYPTERPSSAIWEGLERYVLPRIDPAAAPGVDPGSVGTMGSSHSISIDQVIQNVAEFRRIVEAAGARFLLVYVPAHGPQWETKHWSDALQGLRDYVRANGIQFLDLTSPLGNAAAKEIQFDGLHLRPAGHAIVASNLEQFLDAAAPTQR